MDFDTSSIVNDLKQPIQIHNINPLEDNEINPLEDNEIIQLILNISNNVFLQLGKGFNECIYHKALLINLYKSEYNIETEKIIPILRSYIDITFGTNTHGFIRKVSTAKSYNEKIIINNEINNRIHFLIKTFSMRIIFLVTSNVDSIEHFTSMSYSIKSVLYNNIIIKLINTLNYYIEVYNKYEFKLNSLDNILQIEVLQLSSESESIDENLLNSCNITNDLKMIDILEDTLLEDTLLEDVGEIN